MIVDGLRRFGFFSGRHGILAVMGWDIVGPHLDRAMVTRRAFSPTPPLAVDKVTLGPAGCAAVAACRSQHDRDQLMLAFEALPAGPTVAAALRMASGKMSQEGYTAAAEAVLGQTEGRVASTGKAVLDSGVGTPEERWKVADAFVGQLDQGNVSGAFSAASQANLSWNSYKAFVEVGFRHLQAEPAVAAYARLSLEVTEASHENAGKVGRQFIQHLDDPGTMGQRMAAGLVGAADEGVQWDNFGAASRKLFTALEQNAEAPPEERDLASVALTCLKALPDDEQGGKVAWSFLSELEAGRTDAPSQRLARIMLDAADRGMSWESYSLAVRVGVDALESDGPEGMLLDSARRAMDACSEASNRGKMGRSLMNMLTAPVVDPAPVVLGRMFLAASGENMQWDNYVPAASAAFEALVQGTSPPEQMLYAQVAREALSGGSDIVEQGKIARAFMRTMADGGELGPSLHAACKRAADENLSWDGFENALDKGCHALVVSEFVTDKDKAALTGPFSGQVQQRCQQRADAMKALGELVGIREQLEKLQNRPSSDGIEVTKERLTVGGVRLKVRRGE